MVRRWGVHKDPLTVKNIKIGQKEGAQKISQKEGAQKDPMTVKKKLSSSSARKDNEVLSGPKFLDQEVPPPKSNVVEEPTRNKDILERVDLIELAKTMDILERVDLPEDEGNDSIQ